MENGSWVSVSPMDWWQTQDIGFDDFRGAAWYRLKFDGRKIKEGEEARLYFGSIDGNVLVYINGERRLRRTLKSPEYKGWDKAFAVDITHQIKSGENLLAVKVTNKNGIHASGITGGVELIIGKRQ